MQIIVCFGTLLIFSLWLHYEIGKSNRASKKIKDNFWKKEEEANHTRRADISGLEYLHIPVDRLPVSDVTDPTINSYRDTILSLAGKKILNLTGLTNTELKIKYGIANLSILSEYDNNYTVLVSILQKWGERLYNLGYITEALSVLEFAVACTTDVSKTYHLLATIYKEENTPEKIDSLLHVLPDTKITWKDRLANELIKIKNS